MKDVDSLSERVRPEILLNSILWDAKVELSTSGIANGEELWSRRIAHQRVLK